MNLLLSDDYFLQDCPEHITGNLRSGHATCIRFNKKGDYLAAGRTNGTIVIWDLDTMSVAMKLREHCKTINSLCWSANGRYLLSACGGWRVIMWDLKDGSKLRQLRTRGPVYMAECNPINHFEIAVAVYETESVLMDASKPLPKKYILPAVPARDETDVDEATKEKWAKEDGRVQTTAVIWTADGKHIISGTNKGRINIIDPKTREIMFSEKTCGGAITTLCLSSSGRDLLINAQDRILRTVHLPNLSAPDLDVDTIQLPLEHKFQDVVNRLSWNHCTFSATSDYVAASTYNNHDMYIWERNHGSLVRMLEGPKEEQGMVCWHPSKPLLAVLGLESGRIYIWGIPSPQKWSALAPDFAEVEENAEYVEKEDEFDIHPEEEIRRRRIDKEDEEDVDVLTIPRARDDQLDGEDEFLMPILYRQGDSDSEDEFVPVSTGTMRRRSYGEGQGEVSINAEAVGAAAAGEDGGGRSSRRNRRN